jgi:YbgC/YbaW family acyl-CoA thioester hydrolase
MTTLKKVLESKMKIRFHDCDPFNHLNNSRYLDYIMTARTDQLIEFYDFDIFKLAREKGIGWVSSQTQIAYLFPAFLMEEVIIETQLIELTEKSLLFEALMWNKDKTTLKAIMWGKLVHYNLTTQRSIAHSEELTQFFKQVVNPLPTKISFEERISSVKNPKNSAGHEI